MLYCKFRNFCENLFSRIAIKDIFVTLEMRDSFMIYVYQYILLFCQGFNFTKLRICEVSQK